MDTTRADYLSCYGYRDWAGRPTTPNLDVLAAEGTRFDLAMSTAAVTPVSHAAILSGRFNRDHGVRVIFAPSGFRLPDDVPTLGTEFQAAGYTTLAVHSAFPVAPFFGLTRGFDVVDSFEAEMKTRQGDDGQARSEWNQVNTRRSDETIDRVTTALEGVEGPFFLWLHLWDPHDSIQVPDEEYMPPPELLFQTDAAGKVTLDENGNPRLKRPMKELYSAEIRYMDGQIGRLVELLRERGSFDRTLVAVTADHGQGLGDHGWAAHRILYQEQIRVPLIVRLPGAGQAPVVDALVRTVDVAPTLLDYAGLPALADIGGRTLRPLIEGRADDEPRVHFADQINGYDLNAHMTKKRPQDDFTYSVTEWPWKLVWRPNWPDRSELFDLSADPVEEHNLWRWDHPEAVRLKRELGRHAPWVTTKFAPLAEAEDMQGALDALEQMGYIGGDEEDSGEWDWEYVCPEHDDQRSRELGRCGECSSAMIVIAVGK